MSRSVTGGARPPGGAGLHLSFQTGALTLTKGSFVTANGGYVDVLLRERRGHTLTRFDGDDT